jgi:hypothetical protein
MLAGHRIKPDPYFKKNTPFSRYTWICLRNHQKIKNIPCRLTKKWISHGENKKSSSANPSIAGFIPCLNLVLSELELGPYQKLEGSHIQIVFVGSHIDVIKLFGVQNNAYEPHTK